MADVTQANGSSGPSLPRSDPPDGAVSISTIELFFDLVFVFTITQLTSSLVHDPSWRGIARSALILGVVWWMYAGYVWLTNAVPPRGSVERLPLLVGMGGFLVVALAIPKAFGKDGLEPHARLGRWAGAAHSSARNGVLG